MRSWQYRLAAGICLALLSACDHSASTTSQAGEGVTLSTNAPPACAELVSRADWAAVLWDHGCTQNGKVELIAYYDCKNGDRLMWVDNYYGLRSGKLVAASINAPAFKAVQDSCLG